MGEVDDKITIFTTLDGDEVWLRMCFFEYMYRNEEKGYTHIRFRNSGISVKEKPSEIFEMLNGG